MKSRMLGVLKCVLLVLDESRQFLRVEIVDFAKIAILTILGFLWFLWILDNFCEIGDLEVTLGFETCPLIYVGFWKIWDPWFSGLFRFHTFEDSEWDLRLLVILSVCSRIWVTLIYVDFWEFWRFCEFLWISEIWWNFWWGRWWTVSVWVIGSIIFGWRVQKWQYLGFGIGTCAQIVTFWALGCQKLCSSLKSWILDGSGFRWNRLPCARVGGVDCGVVGIMEALYGI